MTAYPTACDCEMCQTLRAKVFIVTGASERRKDDVNEDNNMVILFPTYWVFPGIAGKVLFKE